MARVVDALARNGVAMEINSRFRLPSLEFIELAKSKGVLFTLGTNNGGSDDLGRLEYSLEMVRRCGLTEKDMWMPGSRSNSRKAR
jgi:histidinol phosphatase-like PHP family hydrolase